MAFDEEAYELQVVRPLRGNRGPVPPPPVMYAVTGDVGDLEAHLRRVRAYWGRKARGNTTVGAVCKRFVAADEELKRRPDISLTDPQWWRAQNAAAAEGERAARRKLVAELRQAYGRGGQITRTQLDAVVRHLGGAGPGQAQAAAREAGLTIIEALTLPADCGLSATQYAQLRDRLAEAGARTVVHLLHPELTAPFAIARGFAVPGQPGLRLDKAELEEQARRAESARDSTATRARKAAFALLRSAYTKVPDLAAIALFHIADHVRDAHHEGLADTLLAARITELGVLPEDARLIAVSLPRGGGPGPVRGLEQIQRLIEGHQLGEARAALAALPAEHAEHAAATALVGRAAELFDGYLREAAEAERRHDIAAAARLLEQAEQLDAGNVAVAAARDRLPAPAPVQLTLAEAAAPPGVRLAWAAGPGTAANPVYRVVRGADRPPVNEADGTRVAEGTAREAVDSTIAPGRPAYYAVFASTNGTVWSRPATGSATVLPRVGDVVLDATAESITGSWQAHPAVAEVRVRRGDGIAVATNGRSFRDTAVRLGEPHHYELTAVYRDGHGRELTAAPVAVTAVPRGPATPVTDLAAEPLTATDGSLRVRLTWSSGDHDETELRRADRPPPWAPGELLTPDRARSFGVALPGAPVIRAGKATVDCAVPAGQHVYVPVSFGAGGAVAGRPVTVGLTAPVTSPQVRRTGDRLTVTWLWPDGIGLARVRWETPGGTECFDLSRAKYDAESGCVLAAHPGGGTVEVRALAVGPTGTAQSPPVRCAVPARAARIAYTISRPGQAGRPLLSRMRDRVRDRHRVVTLTSAQECPDVEVVVVASAGIAMPLRAAQGTELARLSVHLRPGEPRPVPVEVPAALGRAYWIRCFVAEPAGYAVTDPPIDQMKVS